MDNFELVKANYFIRMGLRRRGLGDKLVEKAIRSTVKERKEKPEMGILEYKQLVYQQAGADWNSSIYPVY